MSVPAPNMAPHRRAARAARPEDGRPPDERGYLRLGSPPAARHKNGRDETSWSQTARWARARCLACPASTGPGGVGFEDEGHSGSTPGPPALERCGNLAAQVRGRGAGRHFHPDRPGPAKFACPALLLEEFAPPGVRLGVRKGPAVTAPKTKLLDPFPGHVRRVREAQLAESLNRRGQGPLSRCVSGQRPVGAAPPFG